MGIGTNDWSQLNEVSSYPIASGVAITQGDILTFSATGHLIQPTAAAGVANLTGGLVQALATLPSGTTSTQPLQVLVRRSRITVNANGAGITAGNKVSLTAAVAVITQGSGKKVSVGDNGTIGTVYKVLDKDYNEILVSTTATDLLWVDVL